VGHCHPPPRPYSDYRVWHRFIHTFCRKYYDMKAPLSRSKRCVMLQKKETEQTLIKEGRNHGKIAGWHSTLTYFRRLKLWSRKDE